MPWSDALFHANDYYWWIEKQEHSFTPGWRDIKPPLPTEALPRGPSIRCPPQLPSNVQLPVSSTEREAAEIVLHVQSGGRSIKPALPIRSGFASLNACVAPKLQPHPQPLGAEVAWEDANAWVLGGGFLNHRNAPSRPGPPVTVKPFRQTEPWRTKGAPGSARRLPPKPRKSIAEAETVTAKVVREREMRTQTERGKENQLRRQLEAQNAVNVAERAQRIAEMRERVAQRAAQSRRLEWQRLTQYQVTSQRMCPHAPECIDIVWYRTIRHLCLCGLLVSRVHTGDAAWVAPEWSPSKTGGRSNVRGR